MASTLELTTEEFPAETILTLTYHEDHAAGDVLKLEVGENELNTVVAAGKAWNIQVTILIHETDA